jgi:uridine phosphorylase
MRKLELTEHQSHQQMAGTEMRYWRATGTSQSLMEKAAAIGQAWLKGIGSAQLLMRRQAA